MCRPCFLDHGTRLELSASCPGRFTSGTHWIEAWVDPKAGLDDLQKSKFLPPPGLELRPLGHLGHSGYTDCAIDIYSYKAEDQHNSGTNHKRIQTAASMLHLNLYLKFVTRIP
jgi:hypothetical protein